MGRSERDFLRSRNCLLFFFRLSFHFLSHSISPSFSPFLSVETNFAALSAISLSLPPQSEGEKRGEGRERRGCAILVPSFASAHPRFSLLFCRARLSPYSTHPRDTCFQKKIQLCRFPLPPFCLGNFPPSSSAARPDEGGRKIDEAKMTLFLSCGGRTAVAERKG